MPTHMLSWFIYCFLIKPFWGWFSIICLDKSGWTSLSFIILCKCSQTGFGDCILHTCTSVSNSVTCSTVFLKLATLGRGLQLPEWWILGVEVYMSSSHEGWETLMMMNLQSLWPLSVFCNWQCWYDLPFKAEKSFVVFHCTQTNQQIPVFPLRNVRLDWELIGKEKPWGVQMGPQIIQSSICVSS